MTKIQLRENASCNNCNWLADYSDFGTNKKHLKCQRRGFKPRELPEKYLCMYWTKKYTGQNNTTITGWAPNNKFYENNDIEYIVLDLNLEKGKIVIPVKIHATTQRFN